MPVKNRNSSEWARQSIELWEIVSNACNLSVKQMKYRYRNYSVHHIDHDRDNMKLSNLALVNKIEHSRESRFHQLGKEYELKMIKPWEKTMQTKKCKCSHPKTFDVGICPYNREKKCSLVCAECFKCANFRFYCDEERRD